MRSRITFEKFCNGVCYSVIEFAGPKQVFLTLFKYINNINVLSINYIIKVELNWNELNFIYGKYPNYIRKNIV